MAEARQVAPSEATVTPSGSKVSHVWEQVEWEEASHQVVSKDETDLLLLSLVAELAVDPNHHRVREEASHLVRRASIGRPSHQTSCSKHQIRNQVGHQRWLQSY